MNANMKYSVLFATLLLGSLFASGFVLAESGKSLKVRDSVEVKYEDSYLDSSLEFEGSSLVEDGLLEKSIIAKTEAGLDQRLYRGYPLQAFWGKGWSIDADKKEGNLVDFLIAERVFVTKNGSEETRIVNGAIRVGGMLYTINDKRLTSESILSQDEMEFEVKGRNSVTGKLKLEKDSSYTNFGLWSGSLSLSDGTELDLSLALKERQASSTTREATSESSIQIEVEKLCAQYLDDNDKYGDCKEEVYKKYLENSRETKAEEKQERGWYKFFNRLFGKSSAEAKLELKAE